MDISVLLISVGAIPVVAAAVYFSAKATGFSNGSTPKAVRPPPIPGPQPYWPGAIFISYRRMDDPGFAGRLYDRLQKDFGGRVFMDVDTIEMGADFVAVLQAHLSECAAMVVVIGRSWLAARDSLGRRRLDNPRDFVRLEIETALRRNIRVIPILVDGAAMPSSEDLPFSIEPLSRRNGHAMSNAQFGADSVALISTLQRVLAGR